MIICIEVSGGVVVVTMISLIHFGLSKYLLCQKLTLNSFISYQGLKFNGGYV